MRRLSFLILALSAATCAYAEKVKVKGFIHFKDDTVAVTFQIPVDGLDEPQYVKIQGSVVYFDDAGERKVLKPEDAIEIRFRINYQEVRMISVESAMETGSRLSFNSHVFLKLEGEGKKIRLFMYFAKENSVAPVGGPGGTTQNYSYDVERYLLQKTGGKLKRPKSLSFKKDMQEYFKDCPDLCVKIENKEFGKDDIKQIASHYNYRCK